MTCCFEVLRSAGAIRGAHFSGKPLDGVQACSDCENMAACAVIWGSFGVIMDHWFLDLFLHFPARTMADSQKTIPL